MLTLVFYIVALVLFILAGLGVNHPPRFGFIAWGLAFFTLAHLVAGGVSL